MSANRNCNQKTRQHTLQRDQQMGPILPEIYDHRAENFRGHGQKPGRYLIDAAGDLPNRKYQQKRDDRSHNTGYFLFNIHGTPPHLILLRSISPM